MRVLVATGEAENTPSPMKIVALYHVAKTGGSSIGTWFLDQGAAHFHYGETACFHALARERVVVALSRGAGVACRRAADHTCDGSGSAEKKRAPSVR